MKQSFNYKHVTLILGIAVAIIVVFTLWMSHHSAERPVLQSVSTTFTWDETIQKTLGFVKAVASKVSL